MLWELVSNVTVAVLAVFGFYCALKTLAEWLFPTRQITVAVELRTKQDVEELDMLLPEARVSAIRRCPTRPVVLISAELMDSTVGEGEELLDIYAEIIDRHGAECYLVEM